MLDFLNKYGGDIHSQNGEDFILRECLARLPDVNQVCVELGGNDGLWMSNTRSLIEQGWRGTFIETDFNLWQQCKANWAHNPLVKCVCSHVDQYNINAFVDDKCDVLSLDTDGSDYEIFGGLKAKPKIVIVEIDSSIPPNAHEFNSGGGAGYLPMLKLGIHKGYFLLCHTGNLVFIDDKYRELFFEIAGDGIENAELYFNQRWMKAA